jgi:dTDP-4-dehydrorhamnose reductase
MSIYELVERIANYFGFSTESLKRSSSLNLSQPAKRPPRTGFDLSKAKSELGYSPHTFEQTLDLI